MAYKKPKEKKSRLKDIEDLLKRLPGIEDPDSFNFFSLPKEEPKKEIPNWLKEFLEKNKPDLRKLKPVPMPEFLWPPKGWRPELPLPKPMPFPEIDPNWRRHWDMPTPKRFDPERGPDPRYRDMPTPKRFDPERGPDPRYRELPKPKRFDPERGLDPKYLLEAGDTEGIKGKHSYYLDRRPVTKEEYDAQTEASKEQDIILGDINELTFKGQDLYDMKLEQLGLSKDDLSIDEHIKLMDALRRLDEKKGKGTYIHNPEDPIKSLESFAGGGIMDINRMTVPLGYDNGGDVDLATIMSDMKASRGPAEVTHPIQKIIADRIPVDPYSMSQKERAKELGSKGLEGIKSLFGAKEAGASTLGDDALKDLLGQLRLQLMLEKGIEGSILMPSGNPDKIKRLEERIRQIEITIGE